MTKAPDNARLLFSVFTEIGIIGQLSRTLLENRLPDGLITPHFSVLNHLTRLGDGWTPLRLAQAFQVPKTSMTHTLGTLDQRGLIVLRKNPEDGRSKLVYLTDAGRKTHREAIAALGPDMYEIGQSYPPEQVEQLAPLLVQLREIMDRNREG
ncbi:MAG: MarR family transcriptional regulator [Pseudomonadota bacterium]